MEEDQQHKHHQHVCKFCNKEFPCGRSLGGHMRSHMTNIKDKLIQQRNACLVDGYGLIENPKKTWRLSDSVDDEEESKLCKECGRGFQSWKALFGHVKSHSDSWIMDSQSDTETAAPRRRKRSRRTLRYKKNTTTTTTTTTITSTSSLSFANGSTSVSEIEQEQEEVAMCLMMLSRDVGHWGEFNSVSQSSDSDSVIVEVRSSSLVKENSNADEIVQVKRVKDNKMKSIHLDSDIAGFEPKRSEFDNSNFGGLRNGFKKLESEVSVNGIIEECRFKMPKGDAGEGFEYNVKRANRVSRVKCSEVELRNEVDYQTDSECGKYNLGKRVRVRDTKTRDESLKKVKWDSPRKSKYECTACNKTFHSYQALGGHRASHKRMKGCCVSKTEISEISIEINNASPHSKADSKLIKSCTTNESPIVIEKTSCEAKYGLSKRNKHECPVCFKVFASGQALGGHKRSHVLESSKARDNQTIVVQQQLPEIRDFLDLNLPAPVEEETDAHIAYMPWWVGNSSHSTEQAVGLIFH